MSVLDVHNGVIFSPNNELCDCRGGERPPILHELRRWSLKRKEWGQPCLQIHTYAPELGAGQFQGNSILHRVQDTRCFKNRIDVVDSLVSYPLPPGFTACACLIG